MRVFDTHGAAFHANDPVRLIAELEDVALQALDREIFIDGANQLAFGFEHDLIVGGIRDGAAGGNGCESRTFASADHAVHGIVIDERAMAAASRRVAFSQHVHDAIERFSCECAVGIGAADQMKELILVAVACG